MYVIEINDLPLIGLHFTKSAMVYKYCIFVMQYGNLVP